MMSVLREPFRSVSSDRALLGEGPLWDPRDGCLYWVDIKGGLIFSYDPETEEVRHFEAPGMVSALGLCKGGGYICVRKSGFAFLSLDGGDLRFTDIADPESHLEHNRFNDGKVDPLGGFWGGTMDDREEEATGAWWRLDANGAINDISSGYMVTNGPAFDVERERVYFTDSAARKVFVGDSDGTLLENKRLFLSFDESQGYPDGMTVDREGALWAAFWDGAAVRRFAPDGSLLEECELPVARPTSIHLVDDMAYVTSASIGLTPEQKAEAPASGALFKARLTRPLAVSEPWYFDDRRIRG